MTASRALSISSFSMSAGVGSFLISARSFSPFFIHFCRPTAWSCSAWVNSCAMTGSCSSIGHPVEQIDGFGLGIVVAGNFFAQQGDQESFQIEVTRQQPELLQHQFGAAQALGVFVVRGAW